MRACSRRMRALPFRALRTAGKSQALLQSVRSLATVSQSRLVPSYDSAQSKLDSLAIVQKLKENGLADAEAEAVMRCVLDALAEQNALNKLDFASRSEASRVELLHEAKFENLRNDLSQRISVHEKSMEHAMERLAAQVETLRTELKHEKEKTRADIRYEIDKLSASQRLDLNLERGRIRDELTKQNDRIQEWQNTASNSDVRLDREINALRTAIEAGKSDLLRFGVATGVTVVGLAITGVRFFLMG